MVVPEPSGLCLPPLLCVLLLAIISLTLAARLLRPAERRAVWWAVWCVGVCGLLDGLCMLLCVNARGPKIHCVRMCASLGKVLCAVFMHLWMGGWNCIDNLFVVWL